MATASSILRTPPHWRHTGRMATTLIIGYGNPMCGDDGFGCRVAERLRSTVRHRDVEILVLHQLTPELMEPISRAQRVVFIDAASGPLAGEVREREVDPLATGPSFTHHATPAVLLAGAQVLYGATPKATLITVTGADFSFSDQLSPAVAAQVDAVVRSVLRLLV